MDAMSAGKISPADRTVAMVSERSLRENFRDRILRYVRNAAVGSGIRDDAHNHPSCFGNEGRRRIEQAQKGRSEPGFARSNSHPIPGNESLGSGQRGASVRPDPDAKWAPLLAT